MSLNHKDCGCILGSEKDAHKTVYCDRHFDKLVRMGEIDEQGNPLNRKQKI